LPADVEEQLNKLIIGLQVGFVHTWNHNWMFAAQL
jgi:hypothetical protein